MRGYFWESNFGAGQQNGVLHEGGAADVHDETAIQPKLALRIVVRIKN